MAVWFRGLSGPETFALTEAMVASGETIDLHAAVGRVGDGAFMKSLADARVLAETMLELGRSAGRRVVCLLTDMDQPLGRAVGNALEIREAVETLHGDGPSDFTELVLAASADLLAISD